MDRFASSILKITFEGPDVHEQSLFQAFRPFGRIHNVTSPMPVPAGTPRASIVIYERVKSAAIARNVAHGMEVDHQSTSKTRLRAEYQEPIQAHTIRNWISSHPKIMVPLIVFLLGTLTYTVFDPIRSLMVQSKLTHWFDYQEYDVFKWFQKHATHRFSSLSTGEDIVSGSDVWKERKDAEASLKTYLSDVPSTIAFLYGPRGSGKNHMMETILHDIERNVLVIDCAQLNQSTSDAQLIGALATQTGYRPVFTFLNSITTLIDLASVGVIGQKTGLSTSLPDQLRQILQTTTIALEQVVTRRRTAEGKLKQTKVHQKPGVGSSRTEKGINDNGVSIQAQVIGVEALPIVVINHFSSRVGPHRQDVPDILMQWAANLVENQVAHVVVISDNRENAKQAAKALPTKPLYVIPLSDADTASSLSFMKRKLQDFEMDVDFTREQTACIERLGGRASDLESLIHKVRTGQQVEDAVEEITERGVHELRKKAFGEDEEDSKHLPWTREQAWKIVKSLSEQPELSYYEVLFNPPFSGENFPLREMEHAEIISITTRDGRPSTIKAGRPILRWTFTRLASDSIFAAAEEITYNSKLISSCEKTIRSCEDELVSIKQVMGTESSGWFSSRDRGLRSRVQYVASKLQSAQKKLEALENVNRELRKTLVGGDEKQ
ncbi:hypothetical protein AX15_005055 [Amanita polypyramis BW_CC]|nr:hypothetical protein AX15_005055 [Amanita polypyramis BW_CC]